MNLTSSGCHQGSTKQVMAREARGHRCGRIGPTARIEKGSSTSKARRGRKSIEHLIIEATTTYRDGSDVGIQKLLEDWEEEVKKESKTKEEMDNWRMPVPDPRNTRGIIT